MTLITIYVVKKIITQGFGLDLNFRKTPHFDDPGEFFGLSISQRLKLHQMKTEEGKSILEILHVAEIQVHKD